MISVGKRLDRGQVMNGWAAHERRTSPFRHRDCGAVGKHEPLGRSSDSSADDPRPDDSDPDRAAPRDKRLQVTRWCVGAIRAVQTPRSAEQNGRTWGSRSWVGCRWRQHEFAPIRKDQGHVALTVREHFAVIVWVCTDYRPEQVGISRWRHVDSCAAGGAGTRREQDRHRHVRDRPRPTAPAGVDHAS